MRKYYDEDLDFAFESVLGFIDDYEDPHMYKPASEAMKKSDRDKLPDSAFALPRKRKYPINDAESIRNDIKYFRFVPKEDQEECAKNIYEAAKKFGIEITITSGNPFNKYYPDVKVVPPTRKDKTKRIVPKDMDITDEQKKLRDSSNIKWKYVTPLKKSSAIRDFEKAYGVSVPGDIKKCIEKNNGGTPSPQCFTLGKEKNKVFGNLLSFNEEDDDSVYKFTSVIKRKNIIPFGITPNGDLICSKAGKIVYYDHETDKIIPISGSLTDFLNSLYK